MTKQAKPNPAMTPAQAEQRHISALLAARVDELRTARGLSWERLAGASGLAIHNLTSLTKDLVDPRLNTVLRLCRGLDADANELLGGLPLPVERRDTALRKRRAREQASTDTTKVVA